MQWFMSHPDGTMDTIVAEMPMVIEEAAYKNATRVMMQKIRPDEFVLLMQPNNHGGHEGVFWMQEVARELNNISLLGHKIVLWPDGVSYSHLLIFGPPSCVIPKDFKDVVIQADHRAHIRHFLRQMHVQRIIFTGSQQTLLNMELS